MTAVDTAITEVKAQIDSIFSFLNSADAVEKVLTGKLPIIGADLPAALAAAPKFFAELETKVKAALDEADSVIKSGPPNPTDADIASAIVTALGKIPENPVIASIDPANLGKVLLEFKATDSVALSLAGKSVDVGNTAIGLDLKTNLSTSIGAALDLKASFDVAADEFDFVDLGAGQKELTLGLHSGFDINGSGKLGFIGIQVSDLRPLTGPGAAPEFNLDFGLDIAKSGGGYSANVSANGSADIDLGLKTTLPGTLLPTIYGDLGFHWKFDSASGATPTPTLSFDHVQADLGGLLDSLTELTKPINKFFKTEPFKQIFEGVTSPVPIIDDAKGVLPSFIVDQINVVPGGPNDQSITFLDLAGAYYKSQGNDEAFDAITKFAQAVAILKQISGLTDHSGVNGELIDLGSFADLAYNASGKVTDATFSDPVQAATDAAAKLLGDAHIFTDAVAAIKGLTEGGKTSIIDGLTDPTHQDGLQLPLLEHPSDIIKVLFPSFFDNKPVVLAQFNLPPLTFDAQVGDFFFPIIGPIGIDLGGRIGGGIQFDFGYDTKGIETGDALEGIFVTSDSNDKNGDGVPDNVLPGLPGSDGLIHLHYPAGFIKAEIDLGAGVSLGGIVGAFVEGNFNGEADAFFPDEGLRYSELSKGCIFDPIEGRLGVGVGLKIEIDFGFFSYSHTISIAEATIADFTSKCTGSGMGTASDNGFSLAQASMTADLTQGYNPDPAAGPLLLLNAGVRAGFRSIGGVKGVDGNEAFRIINAVDDNGDPIKDTLAVGAFGFDENYGAPDKPITKIIADMGAGSNTVFIDKAVTQDAEITGGNDGNFFTGGSGNDLLRGGDGGDTLFGGKGNDTLIGGAGNDVFDGGQGADNIVGGGGVDQMTYEHSAVAVSFETTTVDGEPGFIGSGGDAQGDLLSSIEFITGSNFNDKLQANPDADSTLEGLNGNDVLLGGRGRDFLLGGPGADLLIGSIYGTSEEDGTSYLSSYGGVQINLQNRTASGGDAQGDILIGIEDVQGSGRDDVLIGSSAANRLDGWFGDDIIAGGGGADIITAGAGNDIVYSWGNFTGSSIDGGTGIDLLTYATSFDAVTVSLLDGFGRKSKYLGGGDTIRKESGDLGVAGYSTFENLTGSNFGDNLTGDNFNNVIQGLAGDDTINAAAGNDTLVGGAGADILNGGDGIDLADYGESKPGAIDGYAGSPAAVYVNLTFGFGLGGDANGDSFVIDSAGLSTVENLRGSAFDDTLIGDKGDNVIDPNLSHTFSNGGGVDSVDGMGGIDTLAIDYSFEDFGAGLTGGFDIGANSYDWKSTGQILRDTNTGDIQDGVVFTNIEQLRINGTIKADTVYGGQYNDLITTGGGDDIVYAGLGYDRVYTGDDNDIVYSGTGADRRLSYQGGLSPVVLDGGRGIDTLSISLASESFDINIAGGDGVNEYSGANLSLLDGTAVRNFEILGDVITGFGNDCLEQDGQYDNTFKTGGGDDVISPGLGHDVVDGGFDRIGIVGDRGDTGPFLTELYFQHQGDLLKLDYSSVQDYGVRGSTTWTRTNPILLVNGSAILGTNDGSYVGFGDSPAAAGLDLQFTEIERIWVTGSNQSDVLTGTYIPLPWYYDGSSGDVPAPSEQVRGNDKLYGLDGNDLIYGFSGSDLIDGGAGDDILVGGALPLDYSGNSQPPVDHNEVDTLTGGSGADLFVLGVAASASGKYGAGLLYSDNGDNYNSSSNQAIITDFNPGEGDHIQLFGAASQYRTAESNGSTIIYYADGIGGLRDRDELIATVQNFTGLDLNSGYITYVNNDTQVVDFAPLANSGATGDATLSNASTLRGASFVSPAVTAPAFTVEQTNNPQALLNKLFAGSDNGIDHSKDRVELVGDGRAFGTFDNDPFGVGSGIVLSTGRVADLVGQNKVDGGFFNNRSVKLDFTPIGNFNGSTVFRADVSDLGFDISSLTLNDSNSRLGGSGGQASGFDADGIFLSRTKLDSIGSGVDLNTDAALPKLNVFDFSDNGLIFTPGSQRPATNSTYPTSPDMHGAINGIVNNSAVRLDKIDFAENADGFLSLGDGGSLGLNLTQPISTKQPLYLYVGEAGANGEALAGDISASNSRLQAAADMSTDFGRPGAADDTTSFTYHFTPAAGSKADSVAFQFALFTEELPEFAGSDFNDTFKILLNGVNLAHLNDGSAAEVNSLMAAPFGSVNPDLVLNPAAGGLLPAGPSADVTRADAYTKLLTFAGVLQAGENTLTIEVADKRDGLLDSGIVVKAGTFEAGSGLGGVIGGGVGGGVLGGGDEGNPGVGGTPSPGVTAGAIGGDGSPLTIEEGRPAKALPITLVPESGGLQAAVTVTMTPDNPLIDLGGGAGKPVAVTFTPGGPTAISAPISGVDDHVLEGDRFAPISFSVTSDDPTFKGLAVAPAIVKLIDPTNTAPVATDDSYITNEDTPLVVASAGVLANDSDAENDPLKALVVTGPSHGTLALNPDGSFSYTAASNYNGADSFVYKANDGNLDSNYATVSLTVNSVNDPPSGGDKTVTTLEDTPYEFTLADFGFSDPNDNPANALKAVKISTLPLHPDDKLTDNGVAVHAGDTIPVFDIASGKLQFLSALNANGTNYANFTFQVQDDGGTANGGIDLDPTPKTIAVNVTPVNDPPVISPPSGEIRVPENTTVVTTVVATDPDVGQNLTYSIVGGADQNLFSIDPGTGALTFKTAPDFEKPADAGRDNVYDVTIGVTDTGVPPLSASQAFQVRVTDVAETSTLFVEFVSEDAGYRDTLGWYNTQTLAGGILFPSIEADGCWPTVKPGISTASFVVNSADVGNIGFFLVPDGGDRNTPEELSSPIKIAQLANGSWAAATVDQNGNVETDCYGRPDILVGARANALFTETSKNAGGIDYASSKPGTQQTAASLAGDTVDGPKGPLAWEDTAAAKNWKGVYGKPGDADYNDAVFNVVEVKGQTLTGDDTANTLTGAAAGDVLYGLGGDDVLDGAGGDDKFYAGAGNDVQKGGDGNDMFVAAVNDGDDSIFGGPGSDTYDLSLTRAGATITTTKATSAEIGTDALSSIENVIGSQGNDTITLGDGPNVLTGLAGNDTLTGGRGADTFVFNAGFGNDRITDFERSKDVIQFSPTLFANYQAAIASAHDVPGGTVITHGTDSVMLEHVAVSSLNQTNVRIA